ncbi:hypothetical protein OSTOST_02803, partial [Ostertagia ostertagi]
MTLNRGTPMTMAPEIIRGSKNYTTKCDIYSFGIIMWQVIARRESPYLASHPHDAYVIYWNIVAKNLRPPKLSCHELLSRFYEKCWHDDPDQRPTSEDLMKYFSVLKKSPYLASHPHDAYVIYWNIVAKNLRPPKLSCHELLSRFYE